MEEQGNLRIWVSTRYHLKILAARLGLPMVKVIDTLVREALAKLDAQGKQP